MRSNPAQDPPSCTPDAQACSLTSHPPLLADMSRAFYLLAEPTCAVDTAQASTPTAQVSCARPLRPHAVLLTLMLHGIPVCGALET